MVILISSSLGKTATVTADPNNQVSETNENNNVHTLTFEVVEGVQLPVDLVPLIEYVNPYPSGLPTGSPGCRRRLWPGTHIIRFSLSR